ncbi:MAG: hypothetical protein KBF93_18980 [Leptospiraceae bacterium]|nr:hypothetical protein [Leptospiraceae bacterium]
MSTNKLIKKLPSGKTFEYFKKTYHHDILLKDGFVNSLFFQKKAGGVYNFSGDQNMFSSEHGGELKGLFLEIYAPNYNTIVLTPSQENVIKALGKFRNTAHLKMMLGTNPIFDIALSQILPPMPIFSKGEAAGAGYPMNCTNPEHMPITGIAKVPVITFNNQTMILKKDTKLEIVLYLKEGIVLDASLSEFIVSLTASVDEHIGLVVLAPKKAVA